MGRDPDHSVKVRLDRRVNWDDGARFLTMMLVTAAGVCDGRVVNGHLWLQHHLSPATAAPTVSLLFQLYSRFPRRTPAVYLPNVRTVGFASKLTGGLVPLHGRPLPRRCSWSFGS